MIQNSFEKNGGTYTLAKDCLIPELLLTLYRLTVIIYSEGR